LRGAYRRLESWPNRRGKFGAGIGPRIDSPLGRFGAELIDRFAR
jgi:hypothetical protein